MHPRLKEILARKAQIRTELDAEGADLTALASELDALEAEERSIVEAIEARQALVQRVASNVGGDVTPIRGFGPDFGDAGTEERTYDASSPEYRSAFLKTLARDQATGDMRLGELNAEERAAFTFTTSNTGTVLPVQMSNAIWDLIATRYALLSHISKSSFSNVYEFLQATAISAGDAAVAAENTAPTSDMAVTFNGVTLTGVEVKADIVISRKMQIQSMTGFEDFLVRKIAERIGVKMNVQAFSDIVADVPNGNKLSTAGALAISDFREALGAIKGGSDCRVYANQKTIWTEIAALVDENGRAYFIASEQSDDPTLQGRIYGKKVYLDDTLADGVIHVGYVDVVEANLFQDVEILSQVDVKTHGTTYGGYALFEAALGDTRGWATITVTPAA